VTVQKLCFIAMQDSNGSLLLYDGRPNRHPNFCIFEYTFHPPEIGLCMFMVWRSKFLLWLSVLVVITTAGLNVHMQTQSRYESTDDGGQFGRSLKEGKRKKSKSPPVIPDLPADVDDDSIKIQTLLVVSDVYVIDQKGNSVRGLKQDDFRLLEDGIPQQIEVFSNGGESAVIPRSIVMIIDHSSSQLAYLKNSIDAAKVLVSRLPPNDRMAIVTDDVEILQDFTTDKSVLSEKLDELSRRTFKGELGKSLQYSALFAAISEKFRGNELRPIVIFQTDGDQLMGLKGSGYASTSANFSYQDLTKLAVSSGVTIYAINPGISFAGVSDDERIRRATADLELGAQAYSEARKIRYTPPKRPYTEQFLNQWARARAQDESAIYRLAEATGGWAVNLSTPDEAADVYSRIFDEMNQRYMIGYYPTNQKRDGNLRSIRILVGSDEKYSIRSKTVYRAPLEFNR
jgi:VWFA-related protein